MSIEPQKKDEENGESEFVERGRRLMEKYRKTLDALDE